MVCKGNTLDRGYIKDIFPYSLLTTSNYSQAAGFTFARTLHALIYCRCCKYCTAYASASSAAPAAASFAFSSSCFLSYAASRARTKLATLNPDQIPEALNLQTLNPKPTTQSKNPGTPACPDALRTAEYYHLILAGAEIS